MLYAIAMGQIMSKCQNGHASVCCKFSQLCFCQILFESVYSWESYHKNKKGELLIETQCISNVTNLFTYIWVEKFFNN